MKKPEIRSINIRSLSFSYNNFDALNDISFSVETGKITTIIGSNGAGKSTLLKCCNHLLHHKMGDVIIDGKDVNTLSPKQIASKIGYVPQKYFPMLAMKVFESILIGVDRKSVWGYTKQDIARVEKVISFMGLGDIASKSIMNLSGGQQQRVSIARAIVNLPPFVFLDEATSGLDIKHQRDVMQMMTYLAKEKNIGVLAVVHDINLASEFSDVLVLMKNGRVLDIGHPDSVLTTEQVKTAFNLDVKLIKHNNRPYILPRQY